ncbi:hypothetical protein FOL46_001241 [Perkinsus olseni]|uniref:RNase H type-1 domain-containing protein n=1 Tax=Perkinsus olseni TaxID=32597 RepID=A0A7J6KU51_PEROL|nr:hypothetical protein FOL46_001241 [Perkinsus olseni]
MGFGLNIAPKTLQLIMQAALKDEEADAYLDDIYVPFSSEDPSRLDRIQQNLLRHNLPTKSPEDLAKARVLGLQLFVGPDDVLYWKRRSGQHMDLLLKDTFTLRQLLSWSGKLVSHYPVLSWLRPCLAWLRRSVPGNDMNELIPSSVMSWAREIASRIRCEGDPATGRWFVDRGRNFILYTDGSSICTGYVLLNDNYIIEDGCKLRCKSDSKHINLCELNAVILGINAALRWNVHHLTLRIDSRIVYNWLSTVRRPQVHGIYEMLVKSRLSLLRDVLRSNAVSLQVEWVDTSSNLADTLCRVPQRWIVEEHQLQTPQLAAMGVSYCLEPIVSFGKLHHHQQRDDELSKVFSFVERGLPYQRFLPTGYRKIWDQLCIKDGLLCRSYPLPGYHKVTVPLLPWACVVG